MRLLLATLALLAVPATGAFGVQAPVAVPVPVDADVAVSAPAVGDTGVAVEAPSAGGLQLEVDAPDPVEGLGVGLTGLQVLPSGAREPEPSPGKAASDPPLPANVPVPAAAGGAGLLGLLLLRLLGFGASWPVFGRLFSRIEGPKVLDNPVRAKLHSLVEAQPGLGLEQLRAAAGVAWGTAVHHMRRLESHGLVVSQTHGSWRRFYLANTAASRNRAALVAIAQGTANRIARLVQDAPGIGQGQLCATLGLQAPAASKHLARFAQQGLVTVGVAGRSRTYTATPALTSALAVA